LALLLAADGFALFGCQALLLDWMFDYFQNLESFSQTEQTDMSALPIHTPRRRHSV
jgi:hypothetical protein